MFVIVKLSEASLYQLYTSHCAASLSTLAAVSLHRGAELEAEMGVREEGGGRGLLFTVDHNNFLPCLTVSLAEDQAGTRLQYRPV